MSKQLEAYARGEYESVRGSIVSGLKGLGFSSYAAKAFVAILENSPVSAGTLCKLTGIPDSKIYFALKELERRKLVVVQHGNPSLYKALDVDEIASNLRNVIESDHKNSISTLERLRKRMEPLAKRASGSVDFELAYIVKGTRNILDKMRDMILESRKEVILLASSEKLLEGLLDSMRQAQRKGADVGIAVNRNLLGFEGLKYFRPLRELTCNCNILIIDSNKMITASGPASDKSYAIVTQDDTMITIGKGYYENPTCCVKIRKQLT